MRYRGWPPKEAPGARKLPGFGDVILFGPFAVIVSIACALLLLRLL